MPSGKVRVLPGAGKVWAPNRLEDPFELYKNKDCFRFELRRYYPIYRFDAMGSGTPLREVLYISVVSPMLKDSKDAQAWARWAAAEAAEHVKPLDWVEVPWTDEQDRKAKEKQLRLKQDGPFLVTEGLYTINMLRDKVVYVELSVPEKNATIAYRAWKSDASIESAKKIVQEAARSLTYDGSLEEIFRKRSVELPN